MKNYLALDSGGTKVLAVMYDENFRIKSVCRVGSLRDNVTTPEMMEQNVDRLMEGLGLNCENAVLHNISGTLDGVFHERLKKHCTVERLMTCGELGLGLAAAGLFGDALLSLTGTGATTFAHLGGRNYYAGGYGALIADTGSGYWMSRHAMEAAIADDEKRGEPTLLRQLITEYFGEDNLRDSIYKVYDDPNHSPASRVASCAPLITKAAEMGDAVALDILKKTGKVLGEQVLYLIKEYNVAPEVPVTISGSVWRGHYTLFDEFKKVLLDYTPDRPIIIPEFEPIVGAVIRHYYEEKGRFDEEDKAFFREEYARFAFSVGKRA